MMKKLLIIPAILLSVGYAFSQNSNVQEASVVIPQGFYSSSKNELEITFKIKLKSTDSKDIKPLIQNVVALSDVTYFNIVATADVSKAVLKTPAKSEEDYLKLLKNVLCSLNPGKTLLNNQKIKPCE